MSFEGTTTFYAGSASAENLQQLSKIGRLAKKNNTCQFNFKNMRLRLDIPKLICWLQ